MVLRFNHLIRSSYSYQIRRLLRQTWQQQTKTFTHHYSVIDLLPSFFLSLKNTNCQKATNFNASLDFHTHDRDVVICLRASAEEIFSVSKIANLCLGVPIGTTQENFTLLWRRVSQDALTGEVHPGDAFTWESILKTPSLGKSILKRLFWILFLTPSRGKSIQIAHRWRSCQQVW